MHLLLNHKNPGPSVSSNPDMIGVPSGKVAPVYVFSKYCFGCAIPCGPPSPPPP